MMSPSKKWGNFFTFVLSTVGAAIGLGNLWKFPYITYKYGGGVFFLCYLLSVVIITIPILIAELMLGRHYGLDTFHSFQKIGEESFSQRKIWKFVAILVSLTPFLILSYYTVVSGWTLHYFFGSITGEIFKTGLNVEEYFFTFLRNTPLQITWMLIILGLCALVVRLGVIGIEWISKFLLPILFLLIFSLTLSSLYNYGARETFNFLFQLNFEKMSLEAFLEAFGHAFLTLSLGMGITIVYGSYMPREQKLFKSAIVVAALDTFVGFMACFLMFPVIFATDLNIQESSSVLFTSLVYQFQKLQFGETISTIFYFLVFIAAFSSCIALLEACVVFLMNFKKKWGRSKSTFVSSLVIGILGVGTCLGLGDFPFWQELDFFGRFDYWTATWAIPLGGLFIALAVGYQLEEDIHLKELAIKGPRQESFYRIWLFVLRYLCPVFLLMIIVFQVLKGMRS